MPTPKDKLRRLYENAREDMPDSFEYEDFDSFENAMKEHTRRKAFYDQISTYYDDDFPAWDDFQTMIGYGPAQDSTNEVAHESSSNGGQQRVGTAKPTFGNGVPFASAQPYSNGRNLNPYGLEPLEKKDKVDTQHSSTIPNPTATNQYQMAGNGGSSSYEYEPSDNDMLTDDNRRELMEYGDILDWFDGKGSTGKEYTGGVEGNETYADIEPNKLDENGIPKGYAELMKDPNVSLETKNKIQRRLTGSESKVDGMTGYEEQTGISPDGQWRGMIKVENGDTLVSVKTFDNEEDYNKYRDYLDNKLNNHADLKGENRDESEENADVDSRLRDANAEVKRLDEEIERRKKEINETLYKDKSLEYLSDFDTDLEYGVGNEYPDDELQMLLAARHQAKQRVKVLEREKKKPNFFQTVLKGLFSLDVWDFGISSLRDQFMLGKSDKAREGNAEEARQSMLENEYDLARAEADYSENDTFWQRAGDITAQALPFVGEFLLTGGFSAIAKGGTKLGAKLAIKLGLNRGNSVARRLAYYTVKNTGTLVGDLTASLVMSSTTGSARTASDALERHRGKYVKTQDGDLVFAKGVEWNEAIRKAVTANMLEYYTEMLGGHMDGLVSGFGRFIDKKTGKTHVADFLERVTESEWNQLLRKGGVNEVPGEVLEEEANIVLNSLFVGDNKMSDLVDPKTQLDIIGGMFLSIGFMKSPSIAKAGYDKVQYERYKSKTDKADKEAASLIGDKWGDIRDKIDVATNDEIAGVVNDEVYNNNNLTDEEKKAAIEYFTNLMQMRGFNLRAAAKARDEISKIGSEVESEDPAVQAQANQDTFTKAEVAEQNATANPTEENKKAAEEARAETEQVVRKIADNANDEAGLEEMRQNNKRHVSGNIIPVKLKNDDEGEWYVKDGNVVMTADGSMVDKEQSDREIVVFNAKTGETKMIDPAGQMGVESMGNVVTPEQQAAQVEQVRESVRQKMTDDAQGKVTLQPGETYTLPDGNVANIMAVDGNQVTFSVNGKIFSRSMDELQGDADAIRQEAYREENNIPQQFNGAPDEYKNGMNIVVDQNGEKAPAVVVRTLTEDGVEKVVVKKEDGSVSKVPVDELNGKVSSYTEKKNVVLPNGMIEGVPDAYENGMEVTIKDENGEDVAAVVMRRVSWKNGEFVEDENGNIIEYLMDGEVRHKSLDEMNEIIVAYQGKEEVAPVEEKSEEMPSGKEEVAVEEKPAAEAVETAKEQEVEKPVEKAEESANGTPVSLSDEVDENGRQFVLNSKGDISFGYIGEDTGLAPAPILLSEGMITDPSTNAGYGLVHIEAKHGEQIRKAGYKSVIDFVEHVGNNYEIIREGKDRNGNQTYLLQLTDEHDNTLIVELSGDGTYYNINTAGIFKHSYGAKKNIVYNRHTTDDQSAETDGLSQGREQSGTPESSSMVKPTDDFDGKSTKISDTDQINNDNNNKNADVQIDAGRVPASIPITESAKVEPVEIPVDKNGNKDYTGVPSRQAYEDIKNDVGDYTEEAIRGELDTAVKEREKVDKMKVNGIAKAKEKKEAAEKAEAKVKMWESILDEHEAEQTRIAEAERAEAERQEEEARRAEEARKAEEARAEERRLAERSEEEVEAEYEAKMNEEKDRLDDEYHARQESLDKANGSEAKAERAKKIYGDKFDDNFEHPYSVEELVSIAFPNAKILWDGSERGVDGLKQAVGSNMGRKSEFGGFNSVIAKDGQGIPFWDFVHRIYENDVNQGENGYPLYKDSEIGNALIDMFRNAKMPRDIKDYAVNNRIDLAERAINDEENRYLDGIDDERRYFKLVARENELERRERELFGEHLDELYKEMSEEEYIDMINKEHEDYMRSLDALEEAEVKESNHKNETENDDTRTETSDDEGRGQDSDRETEKAEDVEDGYAEGGIGREPEVEEGSRDTSEYGRRDEGVEGEGSSARESDGVMSGVVEDDDRGSNAVKALEEAYRSGDKTEIKKAVDEIKNLYEQGVNIKFEDEDVDADELEDYEGSDPKMLAEQYAVRLARHLFSDDDADLGYIESGIKSDVAKKQKADGTANEVSEAQRMMTEALVEHLNGFGVPISADVEEGQRMIDAERARVQMMSAETANERFNDELEKQIEGTLPEGHIYNMGMPSDILLSTGFPNVPIELSSTRLLEKSKQRGHEYELKDMTGLVSAIQNPVAVFSYGDKEKSQNVIVEIQHEGKNFVVGIHFNQNRRGAVVNDIRGLFPKDNAEWLNWITQGKLLYADKERIQGLINQQRTNLAEVSYLDLDSVAKILQNFENPSIENVKKSNSLNLHKVGGDSPVYYSNAYRAVEGVKQEKATPEQWLKMLEKNGGLKAGEDKWIGLSEWLNGQDKKSLTKQEVMDYIAENTIQIEEVEYGSLEPSEIENNEIMKELQAEFDKLIAEKDGSAPSAFQAMIDRYGDDFDLGFTYDGERLEPVYGYDGLSGYARYFLGIDENPIDDTRLNYTTNGLENKREIALVVPTVEPYNESDDIHFGDAGNGRAVAWVRFGDATDAEGNRVLVIDEIQSKRHQDGREKGYGNISKKEFGVRAKEIAEKYGLKAVFLEENIDLLSSEDREEYRELKNKLYGVPDAPFDKNWHELAMKRMLRYAAENGYNKVAWTTGSQQAERYDLGGVVSTIGKYDRRENGIFVEINMRNGKRYGVFADNEGNVTERNHFQEAKHLSEIIGKEAAEKVLRLENGEEIDGGGLSIGGEGMKGFYDQMLPKFMDKYGKKWGVKTGEVELDLPNEADRVMHSVDVTPEMKESVMEGQPMFFKTEDGEVYGFVLDGKIYIDPRIATAETPIHEYTHLWTESLRKANPKAWEQLKKLMAQETDLMDYVKKKYPELANNEDALMDEVFAHYSGKRGKERLDAEMKEEMDKANGVLEKAKVATIFGKIKAALNMFWNMARDLFAGSVKGLNKMKAEDFADMAMNDLLNGFNPKKNNGVPASEQKTMMGMHNISEDKLRKVLKNGGFANPSVAVVDTRKGINEDYGAITLIPSSVTLEKQRGRNAGTWMADAWTPTYPMVNVLPGKGTEKAYKQIIEEWSASEPNEEIKNKLMSNLRYFIDANDRGHNEGLHYQFLKEKGMQPEVFEKKNEYDKEFYAFLKNLSEETGVPIQELIYSEHGDKVGEEYGRLQAKRAIEKAKEDTPDDVKKKIVDDFVSKWKDNKSSLGFIVDNVYSLANRSETETDVNKTFSNAEMTVVRDENLRKEYEQWLSALDERLGMEEKLFAGYTPSGNRRYVANTLENASRLMNKGGQAGNFGWSGDGPFIAKIAEQANTLDKMRKNKDKLIGKDQKFLHEEARQHIRDEFFDLSQVLNEGYGRFDSVGEARMEEIAGMKGDIRGYLKREYDVEVSDEWMRRYNDLVNFIRNEYPVFYFETKFNRPVELWEFSNAIVPEGTSEDVVEGLKKAGVRVSFYDKDVKGDRERVTNEVADNTYGVKFHKADVEERSEEGGKERYKALDDEFNDKLSKINKDNANSVIFNLGKPSKVLLEAGVEDLPMRLYGNKLFKGDAKHEEDIPYMKNLPSAVADPIAVFNTKGDGSRAILTELKSENGNILAAVSVGHENVEVNIVRSAYGKANDKVINWLTKGKATYINDKKVADYLASSSAPIADATQGSEPFDDAKVQRNSELAKFLGEKLYIRTKNFKDFFGDWENDPEHASKVVDENGEPLVVYHGSDVPAREINVFEMNDGSLGNGAYFTSNYEEACMYAKEKLAGKNGFPEDVDDISDEDVEGYVGAYYLNVRDDNKIARSRFSRDDVEVLANSPYQIKSADPVTYDDNGNVIPLSERFNSENDDIRYRDGEMSESNNTYGYSKTIADAVADALGVSRDRVSVGRFDGAYDEEFDTDESFDGAMIDLNEHEAIIYDKDFNQILLWNKDSKTSTVRQSDSVVKNTRSAINIAKRLVDDFDIEYEKTSEPVERATKEELTPTTEMLSVVLDAEERGKKNLWLYNGLTDRKGLEELRVRQKDEVIGLFQQNRMQEACEQLGNLRALEDGINVEKTELDEVLNLASFNYLQKRDAVIDMGERLNTNVRIITDAKELEGATEKQKSAKGWFNVRTGDVVINLANCESVEDAVATMGHETIGHKGMRELLGDNYDAFLDEVYNHLNGELKSRVDQKAGRMFVEDMEAGYDAKRRVAVDELFGEMAEKPFEEFTAEEQTLWQKLKQTVREWLDRLLGGAKLPKWFEIGDNEMRYMLWRSKENLERGKENYVDMARDVAMREELGLDGAGDDIRYRDVVDTTDKVAARESYERMLSSSRHQFSEAMQDSMLSLKKLYQAILGKDARIEDVSDRENAYLAENRMSSMSASQIDVWNKYFMKPIIEAVHKLTKGKKDAYDALTDYMMAKHGLERNDVMARRDASKKYDEETAKGNTPDLNALISQYRQNDYAGLTALTGETDVANAEAVAKKMVDDYEASHDTKDIDSLWDNIGKATRESLKKSFTSGMMSYERYQEILNMYQYYIPLQGFDAKVAEETYAYLGSDGTLGYGTPIRAAKGRKSKADDPIATIQMNGEASIRQGNRNAMKQRFLNFVQNHPSDLVSVQDVWLKKNDVTGEWEQYSDAGINDNDSPEEVERKTREFTEKMEGLSKSDPEHYKRSRENPNIPYRVVESRDKNQHQVKVSVNGKSYILTINGNPRAAQALNGLTNPNVQTEGAFGQILNIGERLNRWMAPIYTTLRPDFMLSNFLRDTVYANTITWVKEDPNYAWAFNRKFGKLNPVKLGKLYKAWGNGSIRNFATSPDAMVDNLTEDEQTQLYFYEFMMNGGETGWTNLRDIEKHKKEIAKMLKSEDNKMPKRAVKALASYYELANKSIENCARFAAFVTSREMGRSVGRSIWDSKEVSVNFNKKGAGDKFHGSNGQTFIGNFASLFSGFGRGAWLFFNAGMQGLNNVVGAAQKHPGRFTALASGLFLMGLAQSILPYLIGDDDGDDYYNIPEFKRRSNIMIRVGNTNHWGTLPLSQEYRAIFGLGELAGGLLTGKEHYSPTEFAKQFASQISQAMPIDFAEANGPLHALWPTASKALVEVHDNISWKGTPIHKDETFRENDPKWTLAYPSANKQIVEATKFINEATGGSDVTKGSIDLNPANIEYLANAYLGGLFSFPNEVLKTAELAMGKRDFSWNYIPLGNRVVYTSEERNKMRKVNNQYFNLIKEYEKTKHDLKKMDAEAKSGREDYVKYAERIDKLNNSKEYGRYLIMDMYKEKIDVLRSLEKEENKLDNEKLKEYEDILKKECVDMINAYNRGDVEEPTQDEKADLTDRFRDQMIELRSGE